MSKDISFRTAAERFDSGERMPIDKVEIGQWYWVKHIVQWEGEWKTDGEALKKGDVIEWLGCVMEIGSNFIELHAPHRRSGYSSTRVHFNDFEATLRFEPNAGRVIADKIAHYQGRVSALLGEVQELSKRLGVVPKERIADHTGEATNALVAVTSSVDTTAYKNALIEAKEKTLPDLFKAIEGANENLATWMMAPTMSTLATIGPMKKSIKHVEDRIYTLELYAGLTEDAVQIREGDPAARDEKLRVMQRRLYMDEECLACYEAGGMEFKDIGAFDDWLSREENFKRLLPFERSMAAFRVRRIEKERYAESIIQSFINMQIAQADRLTFLYIRNGDQLWRVNCDFDFGEKIVPDASEFDPSQPMMVKMFGSSVDEIIPLSAWEVMRDEELENARLKEEWDASHSKEERIHNPYGWMGSRSDHKRYRPLDPSNVYFDEASKKVSDKIKEYNRVAVIIQGLFDRSLVLHPHDPVKVWDAASFARSIEVVYDATTLTHGEKPDFEAYRRALNSYLYEGSIVTGQDDYWARAEAEKENRRRRNDWRSRDRYSDLTHYRPYGNPGPGRIARIKEWKPRSRAAVFRWKRSRERYSYAHGWGEIDVTLTVPADKLFNISAYKPGEFRQFFEDPRTRQEYVEWAPFLLTAEDYHAGKIEDVS